MIEAFTWGYWGWGGSTGELIEALDAAEALRGFEPPIFVDTRASRQVRAPGFNGSAFEKLIGKERYRWMQGLGNRAILEGGKMRLMEPGEVHDLLDLITAAAKGRRRVIFYCACEFPRANGDRNCHRDLICELLLAEARGRDLPICVSEWPGGEPCRLVAPFPASAAKAAYGSPRSVPMPKGMSPAVGVTLPWNSYAMVQSGKQVIPVLLGPAIHRQGKWSLRVPLSLREPEVSEESIRDVIPGACQLIGTQPFFSKPSRKPPTLAWKDLVVGP